MLALINRALDRLGIIDEGLAVELNKYAELLISENKKYNLTAIVDPEGVAEKHLADSLAGLAYIPDGARVCDVGSGGGLPIVPLALAQRQACFTAIEATGKKCKFLSLVAQTLNIGNLNVVNSRIEDYARGEGREVYDVVTARAVAPMVTLVEYVAPLIKVGGYALIYKGSNYQQEIIQAQKAMELLNIKIEAIFDYVLENGEKRVIIKISKSKATDIKYPRTGNRPRLKPLK